MRFAWLISKLDLKDKDAIEQLDQALNDFEGALAEDSKGGIAYLMEKLYQRTEAGMNHATIGLTVPPQDLDFVFGQPVYTITPRLLLKIPAPKTGEGIVDLDAPQWDKSKPKLAYRDAPLPEGSVLIYPNIEGEQENPDDRPVVHWNGAKAGESVIIGGINYLDEQKIKDIIEGEIGAASEGKSVWTHYGETATLKDLGNILTKMREAGFTNQYLTTLDKYVANGSAEPATEDTEASIGGFFARNRDKERCVSIYIPGSTRIGYHPSEEMTHGGFAVLVRNKNGTEKIRPVSEPFMKANYRYENNDQPVVPQMRQITCIPRHVLAGHEPVFAQFLLDLEKINATLRVKYGPSKTSADVNSVVQSAQPNKKPAPK